MSLTHIEQARAEINAVMAQFPDLCADGFLRGQPCKDRGEMLTDDTVEQFISAKAWLVRQPKSRTVTRAANSYTLKQIVKEEARFHGLSGGDYVSNGILIAAAVATGFTIEPDPPNARLNLSSRALTDHHTQSRYHPPSRYYPHPSARQTRAMEDRVIAAREHERTRMLAEGRSPPDYNDLIALMMVGRKIRQEEEG
jgi:hypothetical protein